MRASIVVLIIIALLIRGTRINPLVKIAVGAALIVLVWVEAQ
jgi:hypothetical protein